MPGAYDALSTKLIVAAGFKAVFAGGNAGIGSTLAQADMGQSNMRDYADHYARIADAAGDVPVFVDADTGFGGVHNVRQAVRAFEAAGAAGLFIQDQVFPNRCGYLPGKELVPVADMVAKVKAALDARRATTSSSRPAPTPSASRGCNRPSSARRSTWRPVPTWRCRRASTRPRRSGKWSRMSPARSWRSPRRPPAARR